MAFGMCNAPATFQRLVNTVLSGISNCNAYRDDFIVYTPTWEMHMQILEQVFTRLAQASLTLNLAKCEFGKATVTYLGKQVGQGQVRPVEAKVAAVTECAVPATRSALRRFLVFLFNKHQVSYSTIEKETLALLLALQHFEVYVGSSPLP